MPAPEPVRDDDRRDTASAAADPALTDLALIEAAAVEAGRIALDYWRGSFRSWDKDAGAGPVSEADLAVNTALETRLRAARPGYGWLSEESPDDPARLTAARTFIVDPIDGTRAFIDGQEGFSVCVAVVEDGRPVAGVVHLPARGATYAADLDGPATLNGAPIRPAARTSAEGATMLGARTVLDPQHWRGGRVPGLTRKFRSSLAWRLCLVAEGQFDAALSVRPVWDWDIAAASVIAAQAGCGVTDRQGRAFRFNGAVPHSDGLIVAGPALHGLLAEGLATGADLRAAGQGR